MTDKLEPIIGKIRAKLKKSEESFDELSDNVNQLSQLIDELTNKEVTINLHVLIPTILDVINNYELKFKGVLLLAQLVELSDHESFAKQGYDDLIIFTLKNQFYHQDAELFKVLFTVCQNALIKFKVSSSNRTNKLITELDEIVDIVLNTIEIGTDDNIRLICLEELPKLLVLLDRAVYKHLNRLIDNFVCIVDPDFIAARPGQIKACLLIFNQITKSVTEKFDSSKCLTTLIKMLFNLNELKSEHNNEFKDPEFQSLHDHTLNCLRSIYKMEPKTFQTYFNELQQNADLNTFFQMIQFDLTLVMANDV